jgi:ribonucleoside-diphosphate reductase alpha chain
VQDALTLAISQGSLRRGSSAVYMDIDHPEIEEFIKLRKPSGGDPNRKALNIHHGVVISDKFMQAVEKDDKWELLSPKTRQVIREVSARHLWIEMLTTRIETGEPYMLFIDTVNKYIPEHHKKLGLNVKMSNLCSEITLPTGIDHLNKRRTAVCCLSSLNLEYFDEWKDDEIFVEDVMRFLDNVLDDFIESAPSSMEAARYSAMRERSVGLGVMGFHSFLQSKMIPMESAMAKAWNNKIFKSLKEKSDAASIKLAHEKGACPDALEAEIMERFSNKMAIAPTASISIIAGNSSPGIEPYAANSFTQKTLSGSFTVRNKHLIKLLIEKGKNDEQIWSSISTNEGSVQHLDFLSRDEKDVFKTAHEIDQRWLIDLSADRTPFISQAQSLNLFIKANIHKRDLHQLHFMAWKRGLKSLYYLRSRSLQRADKVSIKIEEEIVSPMSVPVITENVITYPKIVAKQIDYDECLACQ